jgi:hypothetical protein
VALDDQLEPDLEDGLLGRARVGVRQGVTRGGELLEEAAGHRDMEPALLRGERIDLCPLLLARRCRDGRGCWDVTGLSGLAGRVCKRFFRKNLDLR